MYRQLIRDQLNHSAEIVQNFLLDRNNIASVQDAALAIANSFKNGGKLFSCGNGGSACDAMHLSEELTGRYRQNRPAYPAIAISDPGHISCVANDFGYQFVFSRYLEALGREGDILVGISTSGNSDNILQAAKTARERKIQVIALTGNQGGKLAELADIEIRVSHSGYADRIQEMHIKIIHTLILLIETELAGNPA